MGNTPDNTYALILAGGSGTRFWPVSRNHLPKQLLNLFGEKTLLETTLDRIADIIPQENTLILTNALQAPEIRRLLPGFPEENIIAEPEKRDTAPALALGIGIVAARDPEATMVVLPSDHLIQDQGSFSNLIGDALSLAAQSQLLLTIGIRPTWPCPSYGYIERGEPITDTPAHHVVRFTEKPEPETARGFLRAGNYLWNAGMFIWAVPAVRRELAQHCPELAAFIDQCTTSGDPMATVASSFRTLPKLSIDYALMERSSNVGNLEATFDWDDVGSWISVAKYLTADSDENSTNTDLDQLASSGNIVFSHSEKKIALLGVENLIIVETADALLVADKERADDIKEIVSRLPKTHLAHLHQHHSVTIIASI